MTTDATPQLLWRQFTVVLTIETHGPAGWLIEAVAAKSERAWCETIRRVATEEKGVAAGSPDTPERKPATQRGAMRAGKSHNWSGPMVRRSGDGVNREATPPGEAKAVIRMHKFRIGQIVQFRPDRVSDAPGGQYEVTKQLLHNGREYEYRIKSQSEGHERTATESQLSSV